MFYIVRSTLRDNMYSYWFSRSKLIDRVCEWLVTMQNNVSTGSRYNVFNQRSERSESKLSVLITFNPPGVAISTCLHLCLNLESYKNIYIFITLNLSIFVTYILRYRSDFASILKINKFNNNELKQLCRSIASFIYIALQQSEWRALTI